MGEIQFGEIGEKESVERKERESKVSEKCAAWIAGRSEVGRGRKGIFALPSRTP